MRFEKNILFPKLFESEEPFDLDLGGPMPESSIPPAVLQRCNGKQTPVAPHAQRLLVAASKAAKAPSKVPKEPAVKKPTGKGDGKRKAAAKAKPANTESAAAEPEPKQKSPYSLAKAMFVAEFLGYLIVGVMT